MHLFLFTLLSLTTTAVLSAADAWADGFSDPPKQYRPETWFHLIGGNIAKPGLTADLEAIAGAGLQGIQLFNGQFGGPWPTVEPQVPCLSPAWDDMITHVASECRRLGLRFTMQNCPGWAMSGGPWIDPGRAMRHLVWSRSEVAGGSVVTKILAKPQPSKEDWRDYHDVAVLAFPTPNGDSGADLVPVTVRTNRVSVPWGDLLTGKSKSKAVIEATGEPAWVEVTFAQPTIVRSVELPSLRTMIRHRCSDPGATLRFQVMTAHGLVDIARRDVPRGGWQDDRPLILALPDTTAITWRITFELKNRLELDRLRLSSAARVNDAQGQSAFVLRSLDRSLLPTQDPTAWVPSSAILDLSQCMDATGLLTWKAPAGAWTVVRFGHVNTGAKNGPAPGEATGFECDKLSSVGADAQFAGYIGRLSDAGGPAGDGRLQGMLMDSWECRTQTWTPAMEAAFRDRRGYDLRPWLPALAGWVVDDHLTSERFLRDWRATIDDLLVGEFFGRMASLAHARGLALSFETAAGDTMVGDILRYFGQADTPMCEFWQPKSVGGLEDKPVAPCVSAAHVYGHNRIAAESFTSFNLTWNEHPSALKPYADRHLALGLNHLVLHTFTHNPRMDVVPGTAFGASIGTPFLRNQTWWRHMPAFTTYLARCQFMLQQGHPVADVLWYLGDEVDHKPRQDAPFPAGYHFDYVNPDVLMNRLAVMDGALVTPEGLSWRVLWLRDCQRLTPATLERLRTLLLAGATVVGGPPSASATLEGGHAGEARFTALVSELWGAAPGANGERRIGAGRLRWGGDVSAHLAAVGITPDLGGTAGLSWCHRRDQTGDIYFLANPEATSWHGAVTLRALGGVEFWDPLTGTRLPVGIASHDQTTTTVSVDLPAAGSVFIVVRPTTGGSAWTSLERAGGIIASVAGNAQIATGSDLPPATLIDGGDRLLAWEPGTYVLRREGSAPASVTVNEAQAIPVTGPWTLAFPPGWETPERIELPTVQPWSASDQPAVRDFSGSASYSTTFVLPEVAADRRVLLDLGRVDVIATVVINGHPAGTVWTAPFRTDATPYVAAGVNRVTVTVTNTWRNRLIHDAGLPEAQRRTWTIAGPAATAAREPAGLGGPVIVRIGRVVNLPPVR